MIRILVCEDEALVAQRLVRFVENSLDRQYEMKLVGRVDDAITYLSKHKIDLLFLDLNLHGEDSFEILKEFLHRAFHTIVVSAYTERAIEAFEYGVLDFIGKPFSQERVKKAIDRWQFTDEEIDRQTKTLTVKINGDIIFIPLEEVNFIKAASIYSELHLITGRVYIYDKPLNSLGKILPNDFFRIHRSYTVDINLIISISKVKHNTYTAVLKSGDALPISRSKKKDLIELINY